MKQSKTLSNFFKLTLLTFVAISSSAPVWAQEDVMGPEVVVEGRRLTNSGATEQSLWGWHSYFGPESYNGAWGMDDLSGGGGSAPPVTDPCTDSAVKNQATDPSRPVKALAESHQGGLKEKNYRQAFDSVAPDRAGACLGIEIDNLGTIADPELNNFVTGMQGSGVRVEAIDTGRSYIEQSTTISNPESLYGGDGSLQAGLVNNRNLAMADNIRKMLASGCRTVVIVAGTHHFEFKPFGSSIQALLPGLVDVIDMTPVENNCK